MRKAARSARNERTQRAKRHRGAPPAAPRRRRRTDDTPLEPSTSPLRSRPDLSSRATLRIALKNATTAAHRALDASLERAFTERSRYVAFLRATRAVVVPVEEAVVRAGLLREAERQSRIDADLASLGEPIGVAVPVRSPLGLDTVAAAYGAAYVLEGSTLGGIVLAARVEPLVGVDATGYLRLRAPNAATSWRSFVARLDAWGEDASAAAWEAAEDAAVDVFAAYADALAREGAT